MNKEAKNRSNIAAVVMIVALLLFFVMRYFPEITNLPSEKTETIGKVALAVFYVSLALFVLLLPFVAIVVKVAVVAICALMIWKIFDRPKIKSQLNDK